MSTHPRSFPTPAATINRARWRSFDVDPVGTGEWDVESRDSGNEYTVYLTDEGYKCTCRSHEMHVIHGPLARCKHAEVIHQIADGDCCPACTYPVCRPTCVRRSDSR